MMEEQLCNMSLRETRPVLNGSQHKIMVEVPPLTRMVLNNKSMLQTQHLTPLMFIGVSCQFNQS